MRSATDSTESTPSASSMRFIDAIELISTGIFEPLGFSKSNAGPPPFTERSAISVISRAGSTCSFTRLSSPARSSAWMNSRKSWGGIRPHCERRRSGIAARLRGTEPPVRTGGPPLGPRMGPPVRTGGSVPWRRISYQSATRQSTATTALSPSSRKPTVLSGVLRNSVPRKRSRSIT